MPHGTTEISFFSLPIPMNTLFPFDGTQPISLWHHQDDTTTEIPLALLRRYRHRLYSQVVETAVPVNYAHWYFESEERPLPGDELYESDGTVWTILEVNQSPLTHVWQAVCETFAFAEPTECVDHLRQDVLLASLPVRVGPITTILSPEVSHRLSFYVRDLADVEANDLLRRSDGSLWTIVRVERPRYRTRWTVVLTTKSNDN